MRLFTCKSFAAWCRRAETEGTVDAVFIKLRAVADLVGWTSTVSAFRIDPFVFALQDNNFFNLWCQEVRNIVVAKRSKFTRQQILNAFTVNNRGNSKFWSAFHAIIVPWVNGNTGSAKTIATLFVQRLAQPSPAPAPIVARPPHPPPPARTGAVSPPAPPRLLLKGKVDVSGKQQASAVPPIVNARPVISPAPRQPVLPTPGQAAPSLAAQQAAPAPSRPPAAPLPHVRAASPPVALPPRQPPRTAVLPPSLPAPSPPPPFPSGIGHAQPRGRAVFGPFVSPGGVLNFNGTHTGVLPQGVRLNPPSSRPVKREYDGKKEAGVTKKAKMEVTAAPTILRHPPRAGRHNTTFTATSADD